MSLRFQPVQVATGSDDQDSRLVFHDGFLVAVLVQLSDLHEREVGKWYLEAGFGQLAGLPPFPFVDLDTAQAWITEQLR